MPEFLKPTKVVDTALDILTQTLVWQKLIWTDAAIDPSFVANDTVSIRLPAYVEAQSRTIRTGGARTTGDVFERKVDVTLDTDVYWQVNLPDEVLSLDIIDFGKQVLVPGLDGIARKVENEILDVVTGATYVNSIDFDPSTDDPYTVIVDAGQALTDARVPLNGRSIVAGSAFYASILKSPQFARVAYSGSQDVLIQGAINTISGFTVFPSQGIDPNKAYAFHSTAFVMVGRAPLVPQGVPWGAVNESNGVALRVIRDYDFTNIQDRLVMDSWLGVSAVLDDGYYNTLGQFVPTFDPGVSIGNPITIASSSTATITNTGTNGFAAGDAVAFTALTGGTGLTVGTTYYVIATSLTGTTFQVSATKGGSAITPSAAITAGTVGQKTQPLMVRAVEITVS